jgi:surfactin synthase thioesterase subunit
MYVRWKRRTPSWIEVVPVELPGRGRRMNEPLELTVAGVLDAIAREVRPEPGHPFALFGHSLGAILAFELAHRLESTGLSPSVLFVSGTRAPGSRELSRYAALQSDAELRAELERLDGTPASVLADAELMALALPVLRADFQVAGSYRGSAERRVRAPLVAFGGAEDETTQQGLAGWRDHTESEFALHVLPGGHFFIHPREAELLGLVEDRLRLAAGAPAQRAGIGTEHAWRGAHAVSAPAALALEGHGSLGRR